VINFPGPDKILLLMVIALVVLGPNRLPSAARTAGKWLGELRKLSARFQDEMKGALADPKDALTSAVGDLHREVGSFRNDISGLKQSVTSTLRPAEPTTWASASNGAIVSSSETTSSMSPDASVPGVPSMPGLPTLPPAPDDPSLN